MNSLFLSNLRSKHSTARVLFGWFMLFSLVMQTAAFAPLTAQADVIVDVSHTDGSVSQYNLETTPDDIRVSYTMGETSASGTPTLSALSGILETLNTALLDAKAKASADCSGTASATATADASGEVTIDGVTAQASATANASADCTDTGTNGSSASASSNSTVTITTTGGTPTPEENRKPVITVTAPNPTTVTQGTVYTDLGATVQDHEDGDIANKLVTTGTVNTALVGPYTITYNATDTKNLAADQKTRLVNVVAGTSCELDVYSDTSDHVSGGVNAVATYSGNPRWTTEIPGATWIWNSYLVENPTTDEVTSFTKDITITRPITSAVITLAADNSYKFSLNGAIVGVDNTEYNYQEEHKHVYDVASNLHAGVNTIAFEVKNWALQGSTAYTNPAGVLYHLHIVYGGEGCTTPPPAVNQKPVITVTGANPVTITQGTTYTDLSATVADAEDGNITHKLVATGTVFSNVVGAYTITYNATDSKDLAADTKTRLVNVVAPTICTQPTDTMLIIDRSGSMKFDGSNPDQPMTQAKDAAKTFIDTLNVTTDHVGVVSFSSSATLNMSLTSDFGAAKNVISGLVARDGTNIATALTTGANEMVANGRANTKHVMILLSDGKPDPDVNGANSLAATQQANIAKSKGYVIYTIGLGVGVVPSLMKSIASDPANYYYAPTGSDLEEIYRTISVVECARIPATITGHKYNDQNGNGTLDQGETGIADWSMSLTPINSATLVTRIEKTNTSGVYLFNDVAPGAYKLCEVNKSGWNQTGPSLSVNNGCYLVTVETGGVYTAKDFFNKLTPVVPVNRKPEIIVLGNDPFIAHVNSVFTDPGATASDPEDGNITDDIATSGPVVNTAVVGNYTIKYNVSDSEGLPADEKDRLVKVVSACSDGIDNDHDGKIDMADTGCENPNDDDENSRPVITLIGVTPMSITVGTAFTDPGANATDTEDCLGVAQTACNTKLLLTATGVVNTSVVGPYTITYTAVDSKGLTAVPVERKVNVTQGGSSNQPPVITLVNGNMTVHINSVFTDPGANATDAEDCVGISQSACNTKLKLTATGTVDTHQVGNYTITYNATDTQSLPAQPKTRIVTVVSSCSDGVDNDGDTKIDMEDTGCENPNDDSENSKPVITLIGDTVMQLLVGTAFVDPSATVLDAEDGIITHKLVATGTVFSNVVGAYTITYNATDSQSLAADQKTRTVNVYQNTIPGCTGNCGGETNTRPVITLVGNNPISVPQGTTFSDPGATAYDSEDGDITAKIVIAGTVDTSKLGSYNISYDVTDSKGLPAQQRTRTVNVVTNTTGCTANCGGGSVSLSIYNEKLEVTGTTTVTITWSTNIAADSRVVYGLLPVSTLGTATYYGYPLTTATNTTQTTSHSMVITGIPSAIATYFRPVSSNGNQTVTGIELSRVPATVSGGQCEYLKEYMRIGINNNPTEVMKLQLFLKNFEGFTNIPTNGFFDQVTDANVRAFQDKYRADVLTPWDLPGNTGYVYYTTKKKINEIYCQRAFPLDNAQLAEIAAFRDLIKQLGQPTGVNVNTVLPLVGVNTTGNQGAVAGAATVNTPAKGLTATGATKTTPVSTSTVKGGRIALADLLAISPSMGGALTSATNTISQNGVTTTEGLAKGDALMKQNFFQAAVGSISNATNISEKAVLFILFLLLVALIIAGLLGRKYVVARANVNEMEVE